MFTQRPFRGILAAPHSPFHPDGSLDLTAVQQQAGNLLQHRISGVFLNGTTGESHSLTLAERQALAQRWCEIAPGTGLRVVIHVGSNCLADARTMARHAEQLGATAIAAIAPSYFKPRSVSDLVDCAVAIASAAPATPFYLYDIPSMTGLHLSMPDFLEQARDRIPTLAGLKYSNPDLLAYQHCVNADGGRWDVPWGSDEGLLAALVLGGRSAVGSTYNFAAPIYHRLLEAFGRGDLETARIEQFHSAQVVQSLVRYGYMGASKAVMRHLGVPVGPVRLPLSNPTPDQETALIDELGRIGFFDWIRAA